MGGGELGEWWECGEGCGNARRGWWGGGGGWGVHHHLAPTSRCGVHLHWCSWLGRHPLTLPNPRLANLQYLSSFMLLYPTCTQHHCGGSWGLVTPRSGVYRHVVAVNTV